MISEFEKRLIDIADDQEDIQICVKVAKGSKNPFFLAEYASARNWDDGLHVAHAIADNPFCDLGTALTLFWLAEGICYLTGRIERDEYNGDWADLCEKLITRISNGFYKPGPVSFDPHVDRVQIYKYKKLGVPEVFFMPYLGVN